MLSRSNPEESNRLLELGQEDVDVRWKLYEQLARVTHGAGPAGDAGAGDETKSLRLPLHANVKTSGGGIAEASREELGS
jgi:hypothetical protein